MEGFILRGPESASHTTLIRSTKIKMPLHFSILEWLREITAIDMIAPNRSNEEEKVVVTINKRMLAQYLLGSRL